MTPEGLARLKADEGCVLTAYPDPYSALGKACSARGLLGREYQQVPGWKTISGDPWTIGVGCTGVGIGPGTVWTQAQADAELLKRVAAVTAQLIHDNDWIANVDPVRQDVLINIGFNVGVYAEDHWTKTLLDVRDGEFAAAANDLENEGHWNAQVGARATRLAKAMLTNSWA
jgi:lysozyme